MSNKKAIRFLLLAILVLTGLHVFLSFKDMGNALVQRVTLLDATAQSAVKIAVERADGDSVSLERRHNWRITSPYSALADERSVKRLLDALTLERIRSSYSEGDLLKFGRTRGDYGLDEPSVTVKLSGGGVEGAVSFGVATPVGDGVFASVDGDSRVYVVGTNVFAAANLSSEGFRERALCPDVIDTAESFDIKRGAGSLLRFRQRDGVWTRLGAKDGDAPEPASSVKIKTLLADLARARAKSFVWPVGGTNETDIATAPLLAGYGLDPESAVAVTLHGVGARDRRVVFGKSATDGFVYALVQNGGAIVTVDGALKDMVEGTDFADTRLFPFEPSSVARVSVSDGGVNYLLAKGADGQWVLDAPVAAAADQAGAEALVARLVELKAEDRAEEGLVVSLTTNAPAETVSRSAVLSAISLADLRSREVLKVDAADVRRIAVTASGAAKPEAVVFDRDLRTWTVESSEKPGTVDVEAVDRLLAALDPLASEKVVTLKVTPADLHRYGLDAPRWTIAVDSAKTGALRRNILVGERAQGGSFATQGASDAVFVLSEATVRSLTAPLVKE